MNDSLADVKALVFDVFGTLVDWRGGVAREAELALAPLGLQADWAELADDWRAQYQPAMEEVRSGRLPYARLDALHRRNLDLVLQQRGWAAQVDDATRQSLNRAWHRLDAWPDVVPALARLRRRFLLAPCSNGHIALMVALARRNGMVWDAVCGAELARDYKPQAVVYQAAAAAFDLPPAQLLMVAAHSSDLAAARAAGLRTAFIPRPDESGPGRGEQRASCAVDASADSLLALAAQLGC
ncbi:haloacid dehalogenase type II [Aquabacterium sp. OR-4]|nr:haloacid dehalogenase type II [Aquabacterium sp. OR-4]MDT7834204.1 haloacid dehalogenase type II [Aquabacterium sp. OR-4]